MREKKSGKGQKKALSSRERQFHKWNNKLKHRQEVSEFPTTRASPLLPSLLLIAIKAIIIVLAAEPDDIAIADF